MRALAICSHPLSDPKTGYDCVKCGVWKENEVKDKTIRELQTAMPWTGHYHRDFRSTPMTHKDFGHGLLHVHKAGGKLAAIVNDAEHGGVEWTDPEVRRKVSNYVADLVVCALRMANTCPEGVIDLQRAVEDRITTKNDQLASEAMGHKTGERE